MSRVTGCVPEGMTQNKFSTLPWASATHQTRQQYLIKSRRMRMDVCPPPTGRRASSINATRIAPVPHPGLNPDGAGSKRLTSSRFSPSCPLTSSCRSFPGNLEPSWMLVRKSSCLQGRFPQGWVTVSSQRVGNSRLVSSQLPSFKISAFWVGIWSNPGQMAAR